MAYTLPSSLFAYTTPFASTTGALMHHSNPTFAHWFPDVLGTQEIVPSALRVQLWLFVFWNFHSTARLGFNCVMKNGPFCRGGQMLSTMQYEPNCGPPPYSLSFITIEYVPSC